MHLNKYIISLIVCAVLAVLGALMLWAGGNKNSRIGCNIGLLGAALFCLGIDASVVTLVLMIINFFK